MSNALTHPPLHGTAWLCSLIHNRLIELKEKKIPDTNKITFSHSEVKQSLVDTELLSFTSWHYHVKRENCVCWQGWVRHVHWTMQLHYKPRAHLWLLLSMLLVSPIRREMWSQNKECHTVTSLTGRWNKLNNKTRLKRCIIKMHSSSNK